MLQTYWLTGKDSNKANKEQPWISKPITGWNTRLFRISIETMRCLP